MSQDHKRSYYETLDIGAASSRRQVAVAYRRISGYLTPGVLCQYEITDPDEIASIKSEVDEAYWVLSDATRRAQYDAYLDAHGVANDETRSPTVSDNELKPSVALVSCTSVPEGHVVGTTQVTEAVLEPTPEVIDGAYLRHIREGHDLTIEQISQATKIGRHHILAVESNDFSALPADVYVRGFIHQIARVLGLHPEVTSRRYLEELRCHRPA